MATLDEAVDIVLQKYKAVNHKYVLKVANQIKKIGKIIPTNYARMAIMAEMEEDIAEIQSDIQKATGFSVTQMASIYSRAEKDLYQDSRFSRFIRGGAVPDDVKENVRNLVRAISYQTAGSLMNLSNTTAVSQQYRNAIDQAILAASAGLDSYQAATRDVIRDLGGNGIKVQYASGYRRRLDSAARQNILSSLHQISQQGTKAIGDTLGYDAVELSAHLMSAPDHEPVQGHVFLNSEFEKMQGGMSCLDVDGKMYLGFRRPIGEWNCGHYPMPFSTEFSKRQWTDEQLIQMAKDNAKGCDIDGKHYSIYEASQLMRKLETRVRREKDIAVAAQAAGDDDLRKQCQAQIKKLAERYTLVAKASGLSQRRERMQVEGFKPYKG